MNLPDFSTLCEEIDAQGLGRPVGRVASVHGNLVKVTGLSEHGRIGDRVVLRRGGGPDLGGEILEITDEAVGVFVEAAPDAVAVGDATIFEGSSQFAPGDHWIGRVIDPSGRALDGKPLFRGENLRDIRGPAPVAVSRRSMGERLPTGLAVIDTVLPIVEGQRVGLFAGSGVGKSRLLGQLAASMAADVVVVALIGERGREIGDFVNTVLGPVAMERTVVVAATSDMPALDRRRCGWSAMTVAEHFRDAGKNVLFLADSVTRLVEAHREISAASGEVPALRGFPPSMVPLLTGLCERAGPGPLGLGDITAVFSVLVAGSDLEEPVADVLRGVLDGHIVLSRDIAERGRYPAIDVRRSVSRSLPDAATDAENETIAEVRRLVGAYEQSEVMIRSGLYAAGSDPVLDQAVRAWPELDALFARCDMDGISASFDKLNLILRRSRDPAGGTAF